VTHLLNNRTLLGLFFLLALERQLPGKLHGAGEKGEGIYRRQAAWDHPHRNLYFNRDFRKGQVPTARVMRLFG